MNSDRADQLRWVGTPSIPETSQGPLRSIPLGKFASPVLRGLAQRRVAEWDARAKNPERYQVETLLQHIDFAKETEFGKLHSFELIHDYESFKKYVPLRTYADFEPYFERMRKGERDVLWPGLMRYFGQSSGSSQTTVKHKFLPVSLEQIKWQQKNVFDLMARYLVASGDKDLTGGYSLAVLPPAILKEEVPGVFVGSNPGIMLRHVPFLGKAMSLPKPPVRDIPDYEKKLEAIADAYMDYDVRSISGTTCWFSVLFDRVLERAHARGRKVKTVSEIWPNLRVLFGGGVRANPYMKIIEDRYGRPIPLIDNYNATEGGIFAATDRLGQDGLLVVPDRGVFFEFVPREQHGRSDAERFALWEVEEGKDYSVVVTTSSGLFGYYIGDFVRFTSTNPHRLEFAGRASGVLSLTQELTSYIEIEKAFVSACQKTGSLSVDYCASSELGVEGTGKGRYVLFAEFEKSPPDLKKFVEEVDAGLCAENRVYREHRQNDVAIMPPRLVVMKDGVTRKFMQKIGQDSFQNKFPRIIDESRRDVLLSLCNQ